MANSSNAAQRFEFYKSLAAIRHKNPALWINVEGQTNTQLFTDQKDVYAFIRQSGQNKVLVVINFTGKTVKLSASKIPGLEQYMLKMYKNLKTDGVDLYEIGPYGYSVSTLNEPGQ
jgi:glycosidase